MNRTKHLRRLCAAALLIAVGVVIPLFSPLKIVLEPASFTLASHVAIFIAMFISPGVAAAVTAGTTLGFFLGGFPLVVVLRAASHLVFVLLGALWLQKKPGLLAGRHTLALYALAISLVHAAMEVLVVSLFYFGGAMGSYYEYGFVFSVLGLVGLGSVVHSLADFAIAVTVLYVLYAQREFHGLFPYALPGRQQAGHA